MKFEFYYPNTMMPPRKPSIAASAKLTKYAATYHARVDGFSNNLSYFPAQVTGQCGDYQKYDGKDDLPADIWRGAVEIDNVTLMPVIPATTVITDASAISAKAICSSILFFFHKASSMKNAAAPVCAMGKCTTIGCTGCLARVWKNFKIKSMRISFVGLYKDTLK